MTGLDFLKSTIGDVLRLMEVASERESRLLAKNPCFGEAFKFLIREVAKAHLAPPIPEHINEIVKGLDSLKDTPLDAKLSRMLREVRSVRTALLTRQGEGGRHDIHI